MTTVYREWHRIDRPDTPQPAGLFLLHAPNSFLMNRFPPVRSGDAYRSKFRGHFDRWTVTIRTWPIGDPFALCTRRVASGKDTDSIGMRHTRPVLRQPSSANCFNRRVWPTKWSQEKREGEGGGKSQPLLFHYIGHWIDPMRPGPVKSSERPAGESEVCPTSRNRNLRGFLVRKPSNERFGPFFSSKTRAFILGFYAFSSRETNILLKFKQINDLAAFLGLLSTECCLILLFVVVWLHLNRSTLTL